MTHWLLLAAWLWPLLLAGSYIPWSGAGKRAGPQTAGLAPRRGALLVSAPLPALAAALTLPAGTALPLPWLFLGTELALDPVALTYLTFTSLLWLAAAVYAAFGFRGDPHARRFAALFLLAMAGNLWLITGRDLPSFYVGFALMGLASYGLVIHDGSAAALRAGKVYLVMALLGEVTLFAAVVLIAQQTGTTTPTADDLAGLDGLAIGLVLLGLGVKAGMVPLHLWLPLAHPAAPIPASAVLSGTMIKVALLGWMRFLPVGAVALPDWGWLLAAMGLLTLFYALPVGLVQTDPKTVLAYSSVSKMGFMMLLLGLILVEPALAPVGVAAIALYAAHHALVKGGLFLGVGLRKHAPWQPFVLGALVFLALALAGAPFTSGAVAKYATKPVIAAADWPGLAAAVAAGTVGTTLLMGRFIWVSARTRPHPEPGWLWPGLAWGVLIALVALFPFVLGKAAGLLTNAVVVPAGIALALLVAVVAKSDPARLRPLVGVIPPGDLIALAGPLGKAIAGLWLRLWHPLRARLLALARFATGRFDAVFGHPAGDAERGLRAWPVAGALWIGITALLTWLLLAAQPPLPDDGAAPIADALPGQRTAPTPADRVPTEAEPVPPPAAAATPETGDFIPLRPDPDVIVLGPLTEPAPPPPDTKAPNTPTLADETPAAQAAPWERLPAATDFQGTDTPPPPSDTAAAAAYVPCDPSTPYRFAPPDGGQPLALERCRQGPDGSAEPLNAPELDQPLVRAVQQALKARGHDPGPIDGLIGPRTRAAVRRLHQAKGLPAGDTITFETLDLLQAEGGIQ